MKKQSYRIEYSPQALDHLRDLSARDRARVVANVLAKLSHQPTVETRNRKLLRFNDVAPYELRVGELRVYYDVEGAQVNIEAIGVKDRDVVRIGGREWKL